MKKQPDMYLETHPWKLIENDYHSGKSRVSESLFSLSNEYLGIRGFFEEGYSGDSLKGLYLNGLYEEKLTEGSSYKGISNRLCFMVNTIDWLYFRFTIDGELLDLNKVIYNNFKRVLDFQTGELTREFIWITTTGKSTKFIFKRVVSMVEKEKSFQAVSIEPQNWSGEISGKTGIDYSIKHESYKKSFWTRKTGSTDRNSGHMLLQTENTGFLLFSGYNYKVPNNSTIGETFNNENVEGNNFTLNVTEGTEITIEKNSIVLHCDSKLKKLEILLDEGKKQLSNLHNIKYQEALHENKIFWSNVWERSDIEIGGDPVNQQGIRFCIFQLYQTYNGNSPGANIGAKGLTGEAYNGNAFWDTETYCLPFYLFNNKDAAKSLLEYRYNTLTEAKQRALDLDCEGACFPVATIDGTESCNLWQHASTQFQPSTGVVFAVKHFFDVTGDIDFLLNKGLELLLEICRFLASRVQWSPGKKMYGFYGVMGPDEFQVMVNNNCYTNYMAKKSLEITLEAVEKMSSKDKLKTDAVFDKINFKVSELVIWKNIADNMFIPYDEKTLIFEQHEGFSDLPHIDIGEIPIEDFPLYHSWSYDRIYRNDMIKQPDVLMFILLFNQSFTKAQKVANYDYYEPKCIHESSLSPSVHSILALELEKYDEALNFFRFATRIDLDNYNRNTREGLHTTAIAAAWMNIVYGFAGFRSDGEIPVFDPILPESWSCLKLKLQIKDSTIAISISPKTTEFKLISGEAITIMLRGSKSVINYEETIISTKIASSSEVKI